MNIQKRFIAMIAVVLMMAIAITGCSKTPTLSEGVVASINGTEVSEEEYNQLVDYYLSIARAQYNLTEDMLNKDEGTGMTLLDTLKANVLDIIVLSEVIATKAAEEDVKVDEAELTELYEQNHLKLMEEDAEYKKLIEENNLDGEFIKEQMRKDLLGYKYQQHYIEKTEIAEEAMKTFYDENPDFFNLDQVKAKHILVEEESLAKDIIKRLEAGEDFATLAKEYSIEPAAQQTGGDLGSFGRGKMVPAFEEPVFQLEVGKISDPIKTDFGYHVVIVEEKQEGMMSFEDAKEQIEYHLKKTDYDKHIDEAMKTANIIKKDDL